MYVVFFFLLRLILFCKLDFVLETDSGGNRAGVILHEVQIVYRVCISSVCERM